MQKNTFSTRKKVGYEGLEIRPLLRNNSKLNLDS